MSAAQHATEHRTAASEEVPRFVGAGIDVALRHLTNSELLSSGQVNLIALDTIAQRCGQRWPSRREQVHEHVEATLNRHLSSHGYHLRISDTDVLVCQPGLDRLSAQARCLSVLREILQHFIGDARETEIGVYEVLSISAEAVQTKRVDAQAVISGVGQSGRAASTRLDFLDGSPWAAAELLSPFMAASGRIVRVFCDLAVVHELKRGTAIGVRLSRRLMDEGSGQDVTADAFASLSRSDRLRVDLAGILLGVGLLGELPARPLATIIPVFFSNVRSLETRSTIIKALAQIRRHSEKGLICEICHIDGLPTATLFEVASLVKPFTLFTVGHLSEPRLAGSCETRDAGLHGVSLSPPAGMSDAEFSAWAKLAARVRRQGGAVLLHDLAGEHHRKMAAAAGATHASIAEHYRASECGIRAASVAVPVK